MQKFERLCSMAYPRISDSGKWSLFVKTIDTTNNTWGGNRNGMTPSRWLMELNDQWIRDNPPCEDPHCNDCKNDAMSFDHLKNAFLDRWGGDDRPGRRHGPPSRSYSIPTHSLADSGSETESNAPTAMVPHSHPALHHPPAAPTPPNEPVSEIQETKTQISINAEHGSGQIILSISDNKQKKRRKTPPQDIAAESLSDSRSASPSRGSHSGHHSHRQIEARPASPHMHGRGHVIPSNMVQVIEADPEAQEETERQDKLEIYKPESPAQPPTPPLELATPSEPPLRPRLLEGKICAITGASRGIGRALALGFAREGAHIIAHYWGTKSDPANEEIVSLCVEVRSLGQGCTIVFGDISDPRTSENIVHRAVETYGRLDVAVGNAGMCWYRDFLEVTPELLRRHVDVNLNGNFYFVQAAARQFKRQFHDLPVDTPKSELPDYSIICVSATASGNETGGKQAHFSPTAAGIRELMRNCASSLARYGVRCNTLAPGLVQTKMVKEVVEDMEVRGRLERKNPFGRLGVPADVVGPAVWLAGEMAKWTNGQEIVVDGGTSVG
jgi:NAD(P)-dependent dehydrogenase (short-subunit alcohol dehydrogenase family)